MELISKAFGPPQTNCYILKTNAGELIIDPGIGATQWILQNTKNPLAILITHGHYDHIWSLADLKSSLPDISIYAPKEDAFMLESDCFDTGLTPCVANHLIKGKKSNTSFEILGIQIEYFHFPGHTPGCSIIQINDNMIFSGDFIFHRSIGRYDFPYSNAKDMKESLLRFQQIDSKTDKVIYPGHGEETSLFTEQKNVSFWIHRFYT
ncbi:MBL fold metallo-hydrolase [Helicobacter sp. 13S00477-4]|uniref:MBL fold metallo-hydrolase n=1 Tax=Helicobacter sp. 13S00477-4 TaxID=1905759 RepID=UPI000BA7A91A|nr:MBL fold metallo-hydrolase [Helicobacter sp. 13S00477-4]PAF52748.1 hypothetical protein BKH44_00765 [Helicobacter sp. 13S00477-4]